MGQSEQYLDCRQNSRAIGVRLPTEAHYVFPLPHADWLLTT